MEKPFEFLLGHPSLWIKLQELQSQISSSDVAAMATYLCQPKMAAVLLAKRVNLRKGMDKLPECPHLGLKYIRSFDSIEGQYKSI